MKGRENQVRREGRGVILAESGLRSRLVPTLPRFTLSLEIREVGLGITYRTGPPQPVCACARACARESVSFRHSARRNAALPPTVQGPIFPDSALGLRCSPRGGPGAP